MCVVIIGDILHSYKIRTTLLEYRIVFLFFIHLQS